MARQEIKGDQIEDGAITPVQIEPQEAWINITYLNSWVSYGSGYAAAGYYKDSMGIVHLRGLVKNGSSGTAVIGILPVGYRPETRWLTNSTSNNLFCRFDIATDGSIAPGSGTSTNWVSLYNISFRAA